MSFVKSGTILFIAMMTGNISNYLFQFIMSRHLSVEDFGTMNAVFSVFIIIGIPTGTIMLVVAKYVSAYKAKGEKEKIPSLYLNSLMKMSILGALFFVPFLAFNTPIMTYLKINSGWPLVIIGVGLFMSFIVTVNMGTLQGLQEFKYFGSGIVSGGLLKLLSGITLVSLGFGVNGAVASVAVSSFFVFLLTSIPLSSFFRMKVNVEKNTKDILQYSIPVLLSSVFFAILTNADLIIVKHLFPPEQAGVYASISVLGKTILYLPSALVLALFPIVSESHTLNYDTFIILDKGLLYTTAISLIGILVFSLFPEFSIRILFGDKFVAAAPLLKFYGMAMMFMALISVLISFNLARHRTGFIYSLGTGCLLMITLIHLFHNSLITVILMVLVVCFFVAIFNLWLVYRERNEFYRLNGIEAEAVKSI